MKAARGYRVLDPTMCGGPTSPLWVDDCIVLSGIVRERRLAAVDAAQARVTPPNSKPTTPELLVPTH